MQGTSIQKNNLTTKVEKFRNVVNICIIYYMPEKNSFNIQRHNSLKCQKKVTLMTTSHLTTETENPRNVVNI